MHWQVNFSRKVYKAFKKLPNTVYLSLLALVGDIKESGPVRGNWSNYSRLGGNRHHCHLKKGKTTYVAVWEVVDKQIRIVEVTYVGTHEKAPY